MTAKRDESRDIIVDFDHNEYTDSDGHDVSGEIVPLDPGWFNKSNIADGTVVDGIESVRYLPHSQYIELEAENAILKQSLAALEKERDELRGRLEQYEAEQLARVCPGCHAVAPERCAPGCIDAEIAREREGALMFGWREEEEEEDDCDDEGDD